MSEFVRTLIGLVKAAAEMNAHYAPYEIETLRDAIGKLPTVRP